MIRACAYHSAAADRGLPRGPRSAAHPADELLEPDAVEAAHDAVGVELEDRQLLAVEVLPLALGGQVGAHRAELEGHPELAEQVGHRLDVARSVGPVEKG